jgi:HAD superfamily hydrolase (TIGR01509 family)
MLVIFDCDGVLVDSELISNRALSEALAEIGVTLSVEETMAEFMGRSRGHMLARTAQLLGGPVPIEFAEAYDSARDAAFWHELEPVEGIEDALDELDAAGVATCVASSGDHEKMRLTLGLTGLWDRFEGRIFSATEVTRGKPAPDLFVHAATKMGFAPSDCVVIEDAPAGVEAARAAGMRVLGFGEDLEADLVFTDMRELPALLDL